MSRDLARPPFFVETGNVTNLVVQWLSEGGPTKRIADEARKIARRLFYAKQETSEASATAQAFFLIAREVALDKLPGNVEPKQLSERLIEACFDQLPGKWKPTEANVQSQRRMQQLKTKSPSPRR